ncbi:MAG: TspO/MBR family protein, partial [Pseudolabrys sp.]
MEPSVRLKCDTRFAVFALGVVSATSILGQIATYPNLAPWYAGVSKPAFNPPNWILGPVWTTLYALMAFAFWRILRTPKPYNSQRRYAIRLFLLLLALNA